MTTEGAALGAKPVATRVGRWSPSEHAIFLKGMRMYPKQWKKITEMVRNELGIRLRANADAASLATLRYKQGR